MNNFLYHNVLNIDILKSILIDNRIIRLGKIGFKCFDTIKNTYKFIYIVDNK